MIRKDFQPFNEEPVQKVKEEVEESISHTPIKQQAEEDRPREKLMTKGVGALTNADLLAILIGGGTKKKTAVELMQEVLGDCGNSLRNLNYMTLQDLMRYNGIGEAKALTILAAAEIGKRRMMEDCQDITQFRTGADVLRFMTPHLQTLTHEKSWVLLLNNNAASAPFRPTQHWRSDRNDCRCADAAQEGTTARCHQFHPRTQPSQRQPETQPLRRGIDSTGEPSCTSSQPAHD